MSTVVADDIVSLFVFARVVELRSFTAAAAKLELSKSTISHRIAQLEEKVGARLLSRTTRRISLTPAGMLVYERCAKMASEADAAASIAAGVGASVRGELRVTAPVAFAEQHLAAPLAAFLAEERDVRITMELSDRLVDIANEGIDLAIRITGRLREPDLVARKLASDRTILCASPAYLQRRGTPREPSDLLRHDCLRYTQLSVRDEWRFKEEWTYSVPVEGKLAASSGIMLREAALAGMGIAVLPLFMIANELETGRLVSVLHGTFRSVDVGIYAVHAYGQKVPAAVRALSAFLEKWFKKWGPEIRSPPSSPSRTPSAPR
jgi:DNA-binding transcriptional LysR family regulator